MTAQVLVNCTGVLGSSFGLGPASDLSKSHNFLDSLLALVN